LFFLCLDLTIKIKDKRKNAHLTRLPLNVGPIE
jgi:hypothetical protein